MILDLLKEEGIVAVIRAKDHKEAKEYIEASIRGGIKAIELTYSIPDVCKLIQEFRNDKRILLGVGSVRNAQMAKDAIDAGARYVVGPGFNQGANDFCHLHNVAYLPGCMTITEIMYALEQGNTMVKLFPGDLFGPSFVKAVKAPISSVEIMPTGGVTIDNVEEWFKNGVSCVGVGSSLFNAGSIDAIEALAKQFVFKIKEYKKNNK